VPGLVSHAVEVARNRVAGTNSLRHAESIHAAQHAARLARFTRSREGTSR
jgi:dihydrodipicolinate synthase/N-acetylneuraminate lyase